MNNTVLDLCTGINGSNCIAESGQVVCAGNEDVFYPAIPEAVQYSGSIAGALIFSAPHAQDILPAIQVNANGDVYRFLDDPAFTPDMVVDGVQENNGIDAFQRPLLPVLGFSSSTLSVIRLIVLSETSLP